MVQLILIAQLKMPTIIRMQDKLRFRSSDLIVFTAMFHFKIIRYLRFLSFLILLLGVLSNFHALAQWTSLNSGTTKGLISVFFIDEDIGFVKPFPKSIIKRLELLNSPN